MRPAVPGRGWVVRVIQAGCEDEDNGARLVDAQHIQLIPAPTRSRTVNGGPADGKRWRYRCRASLTPHCPLPAPHGRIWGTMLLGLPDQVYLRLTKGRGSVGECFPLLGEAPLGAGLPVPSRLARSRARAQSRVHRKKGVLTGHTRSV